MSRQTENMSSGFRCVPCISFGNDTPKAVSAYKDMDGYAVEVAVFERISKGGVLGTPTTLEDCSPFPIIVLGFKSMEHWSNFANIIRTIDEKVNPRVAEESDGEKVDGKALGGER